MNFPDINPTILKLGPFEIRWYGLMYIFGAILGFIFVKKLYKLKKIKISDEKYESLIFYIMLGVIFGGRLGYIIFYNLSYYISSPLHIFTVWEGGMSFHGGALGVIIAGIIFCKKNNLSFYRMADPVMPMVSIGLLLGRIGNFINGELYGRVTTSSWGMIFPTGGNLPRHPSQLYEAALEGLALFFISLVVLFKTKKNGLTFWTWIGFYGIFRFLVEFVREPDNHLGTLFSFVTMGQLLSSVMILTSIIGIILIKKNPTSKNIND